MEQVVFTANEITKSDTSRPNKHGSWTPARPYRTYSFMQRISAAWNVLTGKYDALDWED